MRASSITRPLSALLTALVLLDVAPVLAAQDEQLDGKVTRKVPLTTDWLVRIPAQESLVFRGMLGGKGAGADAGSAVLYPSGGAGAAGFIAALITHAVIANSVLSSQQKAEREAADKVLEPYGPTLSQMTAAKTLELAVEKTTKGGNKRAISPSEKATGGAWLIESTPVFTLTQDEQAIVLDNAVLVHSADVPPVVVYKGVVRVVSHPRPAGDEQSPLALLWTADAGAMLKRETAGLWAESLDMILEQLALGPDATAQTQKTIRFPEGGRTKIERASVIEERCDRIVLKTLRGWLMSVPAKADAFGTPPCEITASSAKP